MDRSGMQSLAEDEDEMEATVQYVKRAADQGADFSPQW